MSECFYTLPSSLDEYRVIWRTEPRLRDRIHLLRQRIHPVEYPVQNPTEAAIAHSLFEQLRQYPESKLLQSHWICFLYRRCEMVVRQIVPLIPAHPLLGFQDLFLMASEAAIDPNNFFRKFDESRVQLGYWYPTLISFTDRKIKNLLLPKIRRSTGNDMFGRSNLGLAARSSRRQVKEALEHSGYPETQIAQYLLAWQCFQEYRDSVNRAVNNFGSQDFNQIADLYNERGKRLYPEAKGSELETWLDNIGEAIRRLLDLPHLSCTTRFYFDSNEEINVLENIPFEMNYDRERYQTGIAVRKFIARLLNQLQKIKEKQLLFLRYGLNLNQAEVGEELGGVHQTTIARRLGKFNTSIWEPIRDWVRQYLEIEPSSTVLTEIEDVLKQHYSKKIDRFVKKSIRLLDKESRDLLKWVYVMKKPLSNIGEMIQRAELEVSDRLTKLQQELYSNTLDQIQTEFQFKLQFQGAAQQRIPQIVEDRLERILQLY